MYFLSLPSGPSVNWMMSLIESGDADSGLSRSLEILFRRGSGFDEEGLSVFAEMNDNGEANRIERINRGMAEFRIITKD